jgi:hypothetical protein
MRNPKESHDAGRQSHPSAADGAPDIQFVIEVKVSVSDAGGRTTKVIGKGLTLIVPDAATASKLVGHLGREKQGRGPVTFYSRYVLACGTRIADELRAARLGRAES